MFYVTNKRNWLVFLISVFIQIFVISQPIGLFAQCNNNYKENSTELKNSKTPPDYSIVFPQNKVNRIDIKIKAEDWKKLTTTLSTKFGKFKRGFMPGPPPPGMFRDSINKSGRPDSLRMPPWDFDSTHRMPPPPFRNGRPPMPGERMGPPNGMRPPAKFDTVPDIYVPATINFQGKQWNNTGFRFKGNSSLMMSWTQGIKKFPFRLNFSKYGDSIPEIKGQKFFGFQEMTFTNNISDNSFMHEKIANDLFHEAGMKVPHTAYYEVYIDYGEGLVYFGLYTTIEIIEDTMLKNQFGSQKGNCYKPDGQAGSFAEGTFDKKSIKKKNNKKEADYSDVFKLYTVLNSNTRITNNKLWKTQLDSIFDIPVFIQWLAVNTTIQNWDTYGIMPHNYYLYNNPETNKLTWIPWDNNEALNSGRREELSLSLSNINNEWPLIRYILDQPEYLELYKSEINKFITYIFNPKLVKEKTDAYYALIYPYASTEKKGFTFLPSPQNIDEGKNELIRHTENRYRLAQEYLKK